MMDTARIKALVVLGYNFNLHMLRKVVSRDCTDQAELFRGYFREDRLPALTEREHRELLEFEGCVACGLCPSHCRVMALAAGRFQGPLHLATAASRSQPEFRDDLDSLLLCSVCGQCEPICPEHVPVSRMTRAMRGIIWRVAPEALPQAYHEAAENLKRHGSILGAAPALDLPVKSSAAAALVLGPGLSHSPARARQVFDLLARLGYDLTAVSEGSLGGVAASLGLTPDTRWVETLARSSQKTVIAADPETWRALKDDPRVAGKTVKSLLEAVAEKWPAGLSLAGAGKGPVSVHDPAAFARGSGQWRLARELLARGKAEVKEMAEHGEWSPPVGSEGGVSLGDPALAKSLAQARLADAQAVGAQTLVALSGDDADVLAAAKGEPEAIDFVELITRALK